MQDNDMGELELTACLPYRQIEAGWLQKRKSEMLTKISVCCGNSWIEEGGDQMIRKAWPLGAQWSPADCQEGKVALSLTTASHQELPKEHVQEHTSLWWIRQMKASTLLSAL